MYKSTRAASAGGRRNFPCGLLVRSAALVLLQSEADRLLSYLLAHLLSAAGREIWVRNADAICSSIPRWRQLGRTCLLAARDGASSRALLLLRFSSCRSPRVAYRRAREQVAGRSPARSSRDRENQQCSASKSLLVFLLCPAEKNVFPCPALPGAAGSKKYGPT